MTELLKELTAKDNRIKYVSHEEPLQISENTNSAIEIATGDFIAFADHDDELTPNALFECVKAINEKPQTLVIYTDEDKMSMDGHKFFQPHFKPDYNPDLLCTVNYICHLFVVSRKVIEKVGGLRSEFDGAQDYDFVLRCVEAVKDEEICHIPKSCITGVAMRTPQQRIPRASFMPLKPEDVQYRLTMREQESTQRFLRVNIWGCTERSLSEIMIR